MPDLQSAVALAWGEAGNVQNAAALSWGEAANLQSRGSAYTPPAAVSGTTITPNSLAPLRDITAATRYTDTAALTVTDLRNGAALPVTSVSLDLADGSDLWTLQAAGTGALATALQAGEQPATVQVTLGTDVWRFVVEEISQPLTFENTDCTFRGRSLAAAAGAPYQPVRTWIADSATTPATAPVKATGYFHYDELLAPPEEETVVLHTGPTPELHVVRRGDTLWDISWYYFSDPWQWPKVWSFNGQITNPHWIYPGDLVRLLPKGFLVVAPSTEPDLEPDATPTVTPTVVMVPAGPLEARIRQVAFIDQEDLDAAMVITGAVEDKELLAEGDQIFLSYPGNQVPAVGSRFSVYAEEERVTHPRTGAKVGAYVRVLGEVEISAVKKDKLAQGRIVASNGEIERGARVGALQRQFRAVPPVANEVDVQGTIVARLARTLLIGSGEIVFLDLGEGDGVKRGNRLYVVRRGDALPDADTLDLVGQDDRRFPARALGRVLLIDVGKQISIGLVDRAVEEMAIGDLVMMRKETTVGDAPVAP